ncbi:MAG: hypothetical protein IJK36_02425 [Bacteroidales bacterium]|nr:hypothetical protein [Bacteroidales bacterium]
MTDLELIKQDEMRQRRITLFRNDIINSERLKAFRHILLVQNQRLQLNRQQLTHQTAISQQATVSPAQSQTQAAHTSQVRTDLKSDRNRTKELQSTFSVSHGSAVAKPDISQSPNLAISSKNKSQSQNQQTTLVPKRTIAADRDLEIKAAHFAYLRQHVVHDLSVWSNNRKADIIFIKRENRNGAYFQTFEHDAAKTAKVMGINTKQLQLNKRRLEYVSIPEKRMTTVINELAKRDLQASIINTKGQNVPISRKQSPSLSVNMPKPTVQPKIDAMQSLEQNRQDSRRAAIHVESLSVTADSKGNWRVSGLVNGVTVAAKSIEQADAVNYKKGAMTKEELAEKYQLHVPPKQEAKVTRKNTMARRYTLDNT